MSPKTAQGKARREREVAATRRDSVERAVACPRCPQITPERGAEILAAVDWPELWHAAKGADRASAAGKALVEDDVWRAAALEWIDRYWADHAHGPAWVHLFEAPLWPGGTARCVRFATLALLNHHRHVTGTNVPFGLRVVRPRLREASARSHAASASA